jgi:UDP-N-acetylmuramate dehydrogenase
MRSLEEDRRSKGHFSAPCAGSVFKNNHAFGSPSGKIIDSLGLRGLRVGGACISPMHANIIINDKEASAQDIRTLCDLITRRVHEAYGFRLEAEILFIGQWD